MNRSGGPSPDDAAAVGADASVRLAAVTESLLLRWRRLLPSDPATGADLVARYREPWRRYHDVRHLAEVLAAVDVLAAWAASPADVELAAWFHDAVYLVRPGAEALSSRGESNEEASAQLAERVLAGRMTPGRVAEVARLVRLSRTHDPVVGDANGAVLCDADLAVLARDPDGYDEYRADIRREYAHVADGEFRRGRAEILRALLALPRLYATDPAARRWEPAARANVERELAELEA